MIKFGKRLNGTPLQIDLQSPMGNGIFLLGIAAALCTHCKGGDPQPLMKELRHAIRHGSYKNLLAIFDREFGDFVTFYADKEEDL